MKCWGIFNYRFLGTIKLQKQQSWKEKKKKQPDFMFKHSRQDCVTFLIICVKTFIPHPVPPRKNPLCRGRILLLFCQLSVSLSCVYSFSLWTSLLPYTPCNQGTTLNHPLFFYEARREMDKRTKEVQNETRAAGA